MRHRETETWPHIIHAYWCCEDRVTMAAKRWDSHKMQGWRRGQLESFKLMSKSQAALLRAYASERIRERDAIVEAAITLAVSSTKSHKGEINGSSSNSRNGGSDRDDGCGAKAMQELLDRRKRLSEEPDDLDITDVMVNERLGEELKHLRKECRSQARALEEVRHMEETRDSREDGLRDKLRRTESQYSKLRGLLRGVREELAAKDEGKAVTQEEFESLRHKYDRAKAKEAFGGDGSPQRENCARDSFPRLGSPGEDQPGAGGVPAADAAAPAASVDEKVRCNLFSGTGDGATSGDKSGSSESSGRATEERSSEENRTEDDEREKAEGEGRRLRLELAETNRRLAKAKKGRKVAEKEKDALVVAMAKELGELEQSKDGIITDSNREARLSSVDSKVAEVRRQYAREYRERRRLFNIVQELRGNIRVMCRCRPVTAHDRGGSVCVSFPGEGLIELVNDRNKRKAWAFDQVFGLEARQETVYAEVSPLVISVMDGYNACIFAYGQTGTGKTYTMMGPPGDRGVNARALEDLFARSAARRGEVDDTITLSILEIYNEQIRDLLIEGGGAAECQRKLEASTLVRHGDRGNNVPGLSTVPVSSQEEVLRMLAIAARNRASACTNLNDHSSRSHLILSVRVDGVNRHTGATSAGRLHLIDLAGSERISKSGAAGQALREAQNINRSLSALGDVISARASRQAHVPYRNSTLTYLLQDSLSADSKTLMLVCVSPAMQSAEESSCSLNFAARVRTVELGKVTTYFERIPMGAWKLHCLLNAS
eukprot:jgi/Undpi1/3185/HiC_scaffold_15.g06559.m1